MALQALRIRTITKARRGRRATRGGEAFHD